MFDWINRVGISADRMARMARTVGADLGTAVDAGRIRPESLRSAVARCHGCTEGAACNRWLDAHASGAAMPPGYCRNADLMARLQP